MKFISKQGNYRVVLKHGQPAEPLTGRISVAGMYVKFENGVANIANEEMIALMKSHPAYNRDFIAIEDENTKDPWADVRADIEPEHDVMDIQYGTVGKNLNPKPKIQLPKDKQKILKEMATDMAVEMAKEMAPKIAKELLEKMMADAKQAKENSKKETNQSEPEVDKTTK